MSFEFTLLDALQALRCPVLDALAVFFDQAGAHGEIWIAFTAVLLAAVALLLNDKRMGIPAMVIAVLVTFSRLYLYVHYPTDVIFSIIVGTAFAFIGNALAGKIADRLPAPAKGKYES